LVADVENNGGIGLDGACMHGALARCRGRVRGVDGMVMRPMLLLVVGDFFSLLAGAELELFMDIQ
jgi:hypothetical protein